jgi:hypothetical protein
MATQELETRQSAVPALANTPALEMDANDVQLPKIYFGHHQSKLVQDDSNDLVHGCIFTATGEDDPEPQLLWLPPKGQAAAKPGPIFHVIALKKGKSVTTDGELEMWDFNDPSAPPESWVTYKYTVALPEVADDIPYTMLLTRTKAPAAKGINTVLARNAGRGPAWNNAFQMTAKGRENTKGKFVVPMISVVEAKEANVAVAEKLAVMISGTSAEAQATGDEPAI